jgi:hypothetical protein
VSPHLFVRCVPGRLVTRLGSAQYIGARVVSPPLSAAAKDAGAAPVTWDEREVVLISADEYRQYRREYDGAIRRGDLVRATEHEHRAYVASLEAPEN